MSIAGYILAGGENLRMGGRKKVFLEYGGECFYRHILYAFQGQGLLKVYLSVDESAPYEKTGLPLIVDTFSGAGPLGGICTGLSVCPEEALLVAACDMPGISGRDVRCLLDAFSQHSGIIVTAQAGERLQPLFGIYPRAVLPVLEKALGMGDYRMMHVLERAGYYAVRLPEGSKAAENINTPEAYRKLLFSGSLLQECPDCRAEKEGQEAGL